MSKSKKTAIPKSTLSPSFFQEEAVASQEEVISQQIAGIEQQAASPQGQQEGAIQKEQAEFLRLQKESIETQQRFEQMIQPVLLRQAGFDVQQDETGKIISITKPQDPNAGLRGEIETGLLQRSKAALEGNLPVDPGLLRDLKKFDEDLESQLRKQFGDLNSSPAQEALQRARESKELILGQARRGDLSMAEQLSQQRQGANQGLIDSGFDRTGALSARGDFSGQFAQAGASAGAAINPFQFNRNLASQESQFSRSFAADRSQFSRSLAVNQDHFGRNLGFNVNQLNQNRTNPLASIAGTVLGAASGGFFGSESGQKTFGKLFPG